MHHLTEEGKKILREVAQFAAQNPRRFKMWIVFQDELVFAELGAECHTSACLAGWTAYRTMTLDQRVAINPSSEPKTVQMIMTAAMLKLSGQYDLEVDVLFGLVDDIDSINVKEVVEVFINRGIQGVFDFLDIEDEWESCLGPDRFDYYVEEVQKILGAGADAQTN